jgi:hypothetical protein
MGAVGRYGPIRRPLLVGPHYWLQQAALEIESSPGVDHADLAVRLGW